MNYKIKIIYDIGDSFNHYTDQEKYLDHTWTRLDIAKQNLKRIQDHYKLYLDTNKIGQFNFSPKQIRNKIDKAKKEPWFNEDPVWKNWTLSINLLDNNGNIYDEYAFWCGYFETLRSAEIEIDKEENDLKVSFE